MSKSKLTIEIENSLIKKFKGTSTRYAAEYQLSRIENKVDESNGCI